MNALIGQQEFPNLVAVGHAAGLENVQPPVALAVEFDVAQEQPGVDERGNAQFRLFQGTVSMIQVREQGRDLTALQIIDQPHHHGTCFGSRPCRNEVGDRIDDHQMWLKSFDLLVDAGQVHFQTVHGRTARVKAQQILFHPRLQIEADGPHVAEQLGFRFLEGKIQTAFAPLTAGVGGMAGKAGLADARRAGHQNAASPVEPRTAQHGVQGGDAAGNALGGCLVLQLERRDRQNGDAALVNQERKFVGAVGRASIFDDPQSAGRDLPVDPVIQQQHAVGAMRFCVRRRIAASPKSFVWTVKAEDILEKVRRARAALNKIPTA